MQVAATVVAVQALTEIVWTVRLVSLVGAGDERIAVAVGTASVVGLAALAWFLRQGRARTLGAVVEVAFVGSSVDWLIVFPELRVETGVTMALGALALVLLADR